MMENPTSSLLAHVISIASMCFILMSVGGRADEHSRTPRWRTQLLIIPIAGLILGSMTQFQKPIKHNYNHTHVANNDSTLFDSQEQLAEIYKSCLLVLTGGRHTIINRPKYISEQRKLGCFFLGGGGK
jgi:hypothetical protein